MIRREIGLISVLAVLAGELLYAESDYIISLKTPKQVRDIAVTQLR